MCATAALLAACGDVPVTSTSGDGNGMYSGAFDGAKPADEHRRAFTGWNSNAVGVNVISGTGRPQLR